MRKHFDGGPFEAFTFEVDGKTYQYRECFPNG